MKLYSFILGEGDVYTANKNMILTGLLGKVIIHILLLNYSHFSKPFLNNACKCSKGRKMLLLMIAVNKTKMKTFL